MQSQSVLPYSDLTISRPLGIVEYLWLSSRGMRGFMDMFTVVALDCSDRHVTHKDVETAFSIIRLRHPLLGSRLSRTSSSPLPELMYAVPMTDAHAIREARANLEFGTFQDRDTAMSTLRERGIKSPPSTAIDVRSSMSFIVWLEGIGSSSGQHVIGLLIPHFITDARRKLGVLHEMMELLAAPERLQSELAQLCATAAVSIQLPAPLDSKVPDLSACSADELRKAREVFDELTKFSKMPRSGLVPDGTPDEDKYAGRALHHTFSPDQTTSILRACKVLGVTITSLILSAMAFATLPRKDAQRSGDQTTSNSDDDVRHFHATVLVDLSTRLPEPPSGGDNVTLWVGSSPVFMQTPGSSTAQHEGIDAIWAVAKQCRERHAAYLQSPYFWHFNELYASMTMAPWNPVPEGKAFLPAFSSLGDCSNLLSSSNGIDIVDIAFAGTVSPEAVVAVAWTYKGMLNYQLRHNASRTTATLIDPFFQRVVDILMKASLEDVA
ncbi:hypothetical protein WOLCODRAFT_138512 [Wolfiporia cocos MD-104 SS10]|uniref:Condensation domain-containing protein n=1 Tax=Wolfiporia cocos (strain MD-104) TaxID=742152 RepID=A0A2H3JNB7_WOLCO|nr:hypothetical protein WOLCODRAFT_138512 [Wolfiporia cocos MD-104 SS10]